MTVGIGLIGMGRHGIRYAEHIVEEVEGAELVAASRRDPQRLREFGEKFGVKNLYTDYGELVRDPAVDAVAIVTPNSLHLPMATAAAEAGKHVIVEKPIARTVEEGELMIKAARRNSVKLMVSQNFRYHPLVKRVKGLLPSMGRPYLISMCKRQQPAHGWREDPEISGGGALMDLGVHIFDQARFILNEEPTHISCFMKNVLSTEVEDSFASVVEFPSTLVACDASMCSGSRADLIEIATDDKQLLADRYARRITTIRGLEREEEVLTQPDFTVGLVLKDFVRCIVEDDEPPVSGYDGLRAVEMARACYESSRSGRSITL
jgi:predicted dehydrogenase